MAADSSDADLSLSPGRPVNRRKLLKWGIASALGAPMLSRFARADGAAPAINLPGRQTTASPASGNGLKATFGTPVAVQPYVHGDSWNETWADDDNLYSIADDTLGNKANPTNSNLAVYKISGGPPPDIKVELVNGMPQFGKCTQVWPEDNCCWKASSIICVDGVLYLAASRNRYCNGDPKEFSIQQTSNSVIIKSTDHGKTWSDAPPIGQSMFPGHTFSQPAFVQYGKDGAAGPNESDKYIYAVSNDGTWNNGNSMVLGRVPRGKIGNLNAADWEFISDFSKDYQPVWKPNHENAVYIFRAPGRTGLAGMAYMPGLNLYVLPQWFYPSLNQWPEEVKWSWSRFELYCSPNPWGPWTLFGAHDWRPQGFYNPSIPTKFTSADGKSFWLFCAGDFSTSDHPYYTINMIPVTLGTA